MNGWFLFEHMIGKQTVYTWIPVDSVHGLLKCATCFFQSRKSTICHLFRPTVFKTYQPAPFKGCQSNPKGMVNWHLGTIWHPLEGPGIQIHQLSKTPFSNYRTHIRGSSFTSEIPPSEFSKKNSKIVEDLKVEQLHGGFLTWWYPQNTPKWSFSIGKPMVVGYHHFRKHPYASLIHRLVIPCFPVEGVWQNASW